jgi:chromosome segregation ATPase
MSDDDLRERWRQSREAAQRELDKAQKEAAAADLKATTAKSELEKLRDRLGSIAEPAPFVRAELERARKAAQEAAEEKLRVDGRIRQASQILADLDQAARQLQDAGIFKGPEA